MIKENNQPKDYAEREPAGYKEHKELCHSGKILCLLAAAVFIYGIFYGIYYIGFKLISFIHTT